MKELLCSEKQNEYRSIPFWSWNDKLNLEVLKKQIHWMHENGIGGFFMHARSGLQTEYMSDEWMECVEVCAKEAEKRNMKAWLYDENGWPSGFAGRKLLEKEESRDQFVMHQVGAFDEKANVSYLMTNDELVRVRDGREKGEYLNLYIYVSPSTVDILNPEVVEQFIALTHEAYKERFGKAFPERFEGFFTDEPQYYRWHTPYTPMIAKYFKDNFQEDVLDSLGLLFVEKSGYRKFRYRYWKGMQELMLKGYAARVYGWCEENGIKLTGHYVEEVTMGYQIMCCGGVMPFYEYEHIPGIDWLGKASGTIGELAPKQVGSVAAQLGKKQVLTETFGCCGWDVTPTELKRIAGFQYVNGVNMMCHHLLPYSERGNRKYDYPAHYIPQNPWVKEDYKTFNDYFTRLGYLLGEGEQQVNVALLHPIRSAYFEYKREAEHFGIQQLEVDLYDVCKLFSTNYIEYHFLDETLLAKYGFVDGKQIGCGKCKYDYLVLPNIVTMDSTTETLLRTFVRNGGKVLIIGEKPTYCETDRFEYAYLSSTCTLDEIKNAQIYHGIFANTEIKSTYRRLNDKDFLYVINVSDTEICTQTFICGEDIKSFHRVDILNETSKNVPLTITLKPGEDAVLFWSDEEPVSSSSLIPYQLRFENTRVDWKTNYLPIDKVRYSMDGIEYSELWPCPALFEKLLKEQYRGRIFLKYEFDVQALPSDIYLKTEKGTRDIRAWLNGIELSETKQTEEDYISLYPIDKLVKQGMNEYVLETDWYEDEFVYYALFGENVKESLRNCVVYDSELQAVQLEGRFGVYPRYGYVDDADGRFVRGNHFYIGKEPERVTDITTYGFPFFAGEFTFKRNIFLDETNVLLQIPGEYLEAKVYVNGAWAGKLLYEKELDISHVAKQGDNLIEVRFIISNRNLMGPHHYIGNKDENVSPWSFEMYGTWTEQKSPMYHDDYDLKRFYIKQRKG